jgi:hypothetical protein
LVQTIARCRSCGAPAITAENIAWRPNGTIMARRVRGVRLLMLEQDMLCGISDGLSEGEPDDIYTQIKGATHYLISKMFSGWIGKISRYDKIKKKVLEVMEDFSLLMGMGRIEVEKFTPSRSGSMLMRDPFELLLVTAVITGVLEEIDRCSYNCSHTSLGKGDFRLKVEAVEKGDYHGHSFAWLPLRYSGVADSVSMERCRLCGLPLALAEFRWDELHGVMDAGEQGRRVGILPAYLMSVLASVDNAKKKSDRAGVIEETAYSITLHGMQGGIRDAYDWHSDLNSSREEELQKYVADVLPLRGWGKLDDFRINGHKWEISIVNPIQPALLAGWLGALYTVAVGGKAMLSVDEKDYRARYILE